MGAGPGLLKMGRVEFSPAMVALGLAGVAAVFVLSNRRAAESLGAGAARGMVSVFEGAGNAINTDLVNPIMVSVTGDPAATLGGKVWEWLHPKDADALRYGLGLDGEPLRRSGGASGSW